MSSTIKASAAIERTVSSLRSRFGERLSTGQAVRDQHGRDESHHPVHAPDAVVFAETTEEVAWAVGCCGHNQTPIIPFGGGTSLEGHVAALYGGISLDLTRLNRILAVNAADLDCRVEAGVTRHQLDRAVGEYGLFFPVDPGADATLGGMTATGASGTNAVRYGTMRENVMGLTVVLADGRIIRTGGRARKSSSGYDLTRLLVGSEGTLGIMTEVQLRLHGLPEAIGAAVGAFPDLGSAVAAATEAIQSGVPVARMELLDGVAMGAINRFANRDHAELPTLFFEFHGSDAGVAEQAEAVAEIARHHGGQDLQWTRDTVERNALWKARHDALYAMLALRPGARGWSTDVCVPISQLAPCIEASQRDVAAAGLLAPLVGHVGDGNFHLIFVIDPEDEDELERARQVNERMVHRALAMGGTATGEHGVGYGKIPLMEAEHGDAVDVMRAIKTALDPQGIMNPGKIIRSS